MKMELKFLDFLQSIRFPILDEIMCFITHLADAGILWLFLTFVLLVLPKTRKYGMILLISLSVDIILCNGLLKHLFARVRPCDINPSIHLLIARPMDYSFPSGHTAISFTAVAALYFLKLGKIWKPALILASFIAFSRLYLYVHYPTDILGGIFIGIVSGSIGYILGSKWFEFIA